MCFTASEPSDGHSSVFFHTLTPREFIAPDVRDVTTTYGDVFTQLSNAQHDSTLASGTAVEDVFITVRCESCSVAKATVFSLIVITRQKCEVGASSVL